MKCILRLRNAGFGSRVSLRSPVRARLVGGGRRAAGVGGGGGGVGVVERELRDAAAQVRRRAGTG